MESFELLLNLLHEVAIKCGNPSEFEAHVTCMGLRNDKALGPINYLITILETVDSHEICSGGGSSLADASEAILDGLDSNLKYWQYTIPKATLKRLHSSKKKG